MSRPPSRCSTRTTTRSRSGRPASSAPDRGEGEGHALRARLDVRPAARGGARTYVSIVHRLDKETSGILVFARSRRGLIGMQAQLARTRWTGSLPRGRRGRPHGGRRHLRQGPRGRAGRAAPRRRRPARRPEGDHGVDSARALRDPRRSSRHA
ncbi:MAG: hypothetical protein IPL89_04485 [Acidobacteria bacterium]|nr:hypothetical protein [Acidobacteriota bacterium]